MSPPTTPADLEDTVRREALKRYLDGDEEQSLDLLAVARAMLLIACCEECHATIHGRGFQHETRAADGSNGFLVAGTATRFGHAVIRTERASTVKKETHRRSRNSK